MKRLRRPVPPGGPQRGTSARRLAIRACPARSGSVAQSAQRSGLACGLGSPVNAVSRLVDPQSMHVPCRAAGPRKRPTGVTHLLQQSPQVPSMMYGVEAQQALERYDRAWLAVIPGPSAELVPAEALAGC